MNNLYLYVQQKKDKRWTKRKVCSKLRAKSWGKFLRNQGAVDRVLGCVNWGSARAKPIAEGRGRQVLSFPKVQFQRTVSPKSLAGAEGWGGYRLKPPLEGWGGSRLNAPLPLHRGGDSTVEEDGGDVEWGIGWCGFELVCACVCVGGSIEVGSIL